MLYLFAIAGVVMAATLCLRATGVRDAIELMRLALFSNQRAVPRQHHSVPNAKAASNP